MLEAVPNVSEGRDRASLAAIERGFGTNARVLDVHSDVDHHRSVFTLVGDPERLVDSLLAGIAVAIDRIDLRSHTGVHPRVGAVDVVPIVPFPDDDMEVAKATARTVAGRVGSELGLPVFLYGEIGGGRRPAFFRAGGLETLVRRMESGELVPDAGPRHIDPGPGAVLVGARQPLIAYNLVLETGDVEVARAIASVVRESGGGMPGVQAIGVFLPSSGRVQVSMNVLDIERAPLHTVVERVRAEAAPRGIAVASGELVGLVPARVLRAARDARVELPGVDESRVLENVLGSRGLSGATTRLDP
ncbi:MAG TPA: glutamate formimidoyltransferase [Gaiellaceae bacterium]|nr:glutamate formimidoyltransferase [Gaiellaceae bacterium]